MKKVYLQPVLEIADVNCDDVITNSPIDTEGDGFFNIDNGGFDSLC